MKSDDLAPGDIATIWYNYTELNLTQSVTLWKDQGGSAIVGRARASEAHLIIARVTNCRQMSQHSHLTADPCDQVLVLTPNMELGWNETKFFVKVQDEAG